MKFLRIVDRELCVAARNRWTYRARVIAAGTALAIGTGIWLLTQSMALGGLIQPGEYIYLSLTWLGMLYCLIEGARNTSDCLSSERREGTLGLLFLTDLSGWDVVLGKLAATSLNTIGCALAVIPMLSLSLLMGGVTTGEFWRACLVMATALFCSMSVGMWISMRSRSEHKALFGSAVLLGLLVYIPTQLDALFEYLGSPIYVSAQPSEAKVVMAATLPQRIGVQRLLGKLLFLPLRPGGPVRRQGSLLHTLGAPQAENKISGDRP